MAAMEVFDVTKVPFTSISRENWMMLKRLDRDSAYDALQMIASYVIDGEESSYDGIAGMVAEQVVSVIKRKGEKSFNSSANLEKANAAKQAKAAEKKIEQPSTLPTCDIPSEDKDRIEISDFRDENLAVDEFDFVESQINNINRMYGEFKNDKPFTTIFDSAMDNVFDDWRNNKPLYMSLQGKIYNVFYQKKLDYGQ